MKSRQNVKETWKEAKLPEGFDFSFRDKGEDVIKCQISQKNYSKCQMTLKITANKVTKIKTNFTTYALEIEAIVNYLSDVFQNHEHTFPKQLQLSYSNLLTINSLRQQHRLQEPYKLNIVKSKNIIIIKNDKPSYPNRIISNSSISFNKEQLFTLIPPQQYLQFAFNSSIDNLHQFFSIVWKTRQRQQFISQTNTMPHVDENPRFEEIKEEEDILNFTLMQTEQKQFIQHLNLVMKPKVQVKQWNENMVEIKLQPADYKMIHQWTTQFQIEDHQSTIRLMLYEYQVKIEPKVMGIIKKYFQNKPITKEIQNMLELNDSYDVECLCGFLSLESFTTQVICTMMLQIESNIQILQQLFEHHNYIWDYQFESAHSIIKQLISKKQMTSVSQRSKRFNFVKNNNFGLITGWILIGNEQMHIQMKLLADILISLKKQKDFICLKLIKKMCSQLLESFHAIQEWNECLCQGKYRNEIRNSNNGWNKISQQCIWCNEKVMVNFVSCGQCGHGGHSQHMQQYFKQFRKCGWCECECKI